MAWAAKVIVLAAAWSGAAGAAELTLKRVVLSSGGVGLYEYDAQVEGDASLELKAPRGEVDDILKSLVVFDDHGGVGALDAPLEAPLSRAFDALPFDRGALASAPGLLGALQGAEVEVGGPVRIAGRIVGVAEETAKGGAKRHRVSVFGADGLRQFVLEEAESVKFADPVLAQQIAGALAKIAAAGGRNTVTLRLAAKGVGARTLHVAYLAAAPAWKTSYRLVLDREPGAEKGKLQAWATLENLSGQDWRDVDLTLVSSRPVAFRQDLYRAYMIDRAKAPLDLGGAPAPEMDRGALARPAPARAKAARGEAFAAAPAPVVAQDAPAPALAEAAETAAAQESVTQVAFHLPSPVSLGDGRSLSLPIVDAAAPLRRVALYDPRLDRRHPLSAVEFVNDGPSALPPGIVTLYENGPGGAAFLGDARLSATPAGERRLLAFALDQKTTVEEDDSGSTTLIRARLAKGLLTLDDLLRARAAYLVKADAPRRLIVLVDKLSGGRVTEPAGAIVAEAQERLRVTFDVPAGDAQTFAVVQERTQTRGVALADLDDAALATYATSGGLDAQARGRLETLAALRATQAEAERALSETDVQIEQTIADQTRLKNLLGAAAAGSDLQKRFLSELDADESELVRLRGERASREGARKAARRAVEDFVAAG